MDKSLLEKYKKQEDKLLLSKIIDKSKFCVEKNKIQTTDFLSLEQKGLIINFLNKQKENNYIFYGGIENSERTKLIFYPDKLKDIIENNKFDFNTIFSVIRISLPNELIDKYNHRIYLGGLIKLGIKREKIGDINVYNNGADIIISQDIEKFLINSIKELTRFNKSTVEKIKLEDIEKVETKVQIEKVSVSSMRLDNIVSELVKCSRNKANEYIFEERVLVNHEVITKVSKEIKEKDVITIRGKGRFTISEILGNNKKGKTLLQIEKNI